MGKHHGFQPKGFVNPLAAARSSEPVSRHEGVATITIKEYLARPRPTLDEFKERIAEKEREQQRLDEWEEQSGAQYRRLLARDRKKKLAAAAAGKRARSSSSSSSSGSSSSSSSSGSSSSSSSDGSAHRHRKKHRHRHGKHRHRKEARTEAAAGPWKLSEFFRAATKAAAPGSDAPAADTPSSRPSHHHHHRHHRHHHRHHRSRSRSRSREHDTAQS